MSLWWFFREFAKSPGEIGAIAPSGAQLARRIVRAADIRPGHRVIELGAGTGAFTGELASIPGIDFLALEPNPQLAGLLAKKFDGLRVSERPAEELDLVLAERGWDRVDRIVSGLPFAAWPAEAQDAVFAAVSEALTPGGRMVTFSYLTSQLFGPAKRLRRVLDTRFDRVDRTETQWRNLPPAFVYVCDGPATTPDT